MGYMSQPQASAPRRSGRIAPLAKLPVFWALDGCRVLVAGGSDGAAWKAELLAACGAEVHVFAPRGAVGAAMTALFGEASPDGGSGSFVHHDCGWDEAYFRDFAMAVGDVETEAEARLFVAAAAKAGVPVNVIDKPAFCQFQFGSIVNRSPVVIGISTDGAAPILAQAIRRRVEAILPLALQSWAVLAARLRDRVNAALLPGRPRRRFWERFADRALSAEAGPAEWSAALVEEEIDHAVRSDCEGVGTVTVVTAVSGDPDLLTLKAVRALQGCDVIVHDRTAPAGVLDLGRREAERVVADAAPQAAAHRVAELARAGRSVVRLAADPAATALEIDLLRVMGIRPIRMASVEAPDAPPARTPHLRLAT